MTKTHATGAENVRWDLDHLYESEADLKAGIERAADLSAAFEQRYRGRIATLAAADLAEALELLEEIYDALGRAGTFAFLNWATNTEDPARGALMQHVQEASTQVSKLLIFVETEWSALPQDRFEELFSDERLARFAHHLELVWLRRDHLLSEPEEKILAETSVTGRTAWTRFFDESLGAARFHLRGEDLPEQTVLAKLHEPDRSLRRDAALSLTEGLERLSRPLTFVFNTVLADKATSDRLRGYNHWLASRNLDNETTDEAVEALISAVTSRFDLSQRFYRLKARLLGLEGEMMDYDRYAPIREVEGEIGWEDARRIVTDAYGAFHPELEQIVDRFFDERWIDAPVVPGKRGGAFSHGAVPSAHPYIMLNYTGRVRDVQTLAHELGHGVHQFLSREQGIFHADTPLTTAETASVFGEMLTFHALLDRETEPANRLALLVHKIDDSMATVFRQVSMNRFEDRIHTRRRETGELSTDDFDRLWVETQSPMFGESLTLGEHYRRWWAYIPHFIHTPGYVYAYAFGELLVLALYQRYEDGVDGFEEAYMDLLRAGGSDWPHRLVERLGIDLGDPDFWARGLKAIERLIVEAEELAGAGGD